MKRFTATVTALALPIRRVTCFFFGRNHTTIHRIVVGVLVMSAGIYFSDMIESKCLAGYLCKGIGFSLHGFGLAPLIELATGSAE